MACLAITVQAAGFAYRRARRRARHARRTRWPGVPGRWSAPRRRISSSTRCLIAVADRPRDAAVVHRGAGTRISCGARRATSSAPASRRSRRVGVQGSGIWLALLLAAPLYLTYRTYKVYLGRIDDERRHVQEMADLHLATIEALALAIDAKDQTAQSHIRRVQVYAAGLARGAGHARQRDPGRQDGGAAARHRQARGARAHPVEARAADAGRVPEDPHPSAGRRRDHQRRAVSRIRSRR